MLKKKLKIFEYCGWRPTCKFAIFKKFRRVLSKRGICSERHFHVLIISIKYYKNNSKIMLPKKLKIFKYSGAKPTCKFATLKKFRRVL